MKKIALFLTLILLVLFIGCTQVKDDGTTMMEFTKLKQEYGVNDAFSPNPSVMNDYINDLSELRVQSSAGISKIFDAEISSAQSFYYLLNAYEKLKDIDFFPSKCNIVEIRKSKSYIDTSKFISLSIKQSDESSLMIARLNASELNQLRPNQLLMVKQYADQAKSLKLELESICS